MICNLESKFFIFSNIIFDISKKWGRVLRYYKSFEQSARLFCFDCVFNKQTKTKENKSNKMN